MRRYALVTGDRQHARWLLEESLVRRVSFARAALDERAEGVHRDGRRENRPTSRPQNELPGA